MTDTEKLADHERRIQDLEAKVDQLLRIIDRQQREAKGR